MKDMNIELGLPKKTKIEMMLDMKNPINKQVKNFIEKLQQQNRSCQKQTSRDRRQSRRIKSLSKGK